MNYPKISIVTPSFNQGQFLERTILSVINQNYPNLEYIIIDGGSTDGSVDIIKKYERHLTYWISEKDSGQSEAINKGIKLATGEFITWLNSDDIIFKGALLEVANAIGNNKLINWLAGNIIWISTDDKIIKCRKGEKWNAMLPRIGELNIYGPSSFIKREILLQIGLLNIDLHYMMDTDLWWRLYKAGYKFYRLSKYIWGYRLHKNAKMSSHMFNESETKYKNHPVWEARKNEENFIRESYLTGINEFQKLIGQFILNMLRVLSLAYPISIVHSILYKDKDYSILTNGK